MLDEQSRYGIVAALRRVLELAPRNADVETQMNVIAPARVAVDVVERLLSSLPAENDLLVLLSLIQAGLPGNGWGTEGYRVAQLRDALVAALHNARSEWVSADAGKAEYAEAVIREAASTLYACGEGEPEEVIQRGGRELPADCIGAGLAATFPGGRRVAVDVEYDPGEGGWRVHATWECPEGEGPCIVRPLDEPTMGEAIRVTSASIREAVSMAHNPSRWAIRAGGLRLLVINGKG